MQFVNKITMKTIDAQPKARSVTRPEVLCHIFGVARNFRLGSSTFGLFHSFIGDFEAVNLKTGEVTKAGRILLPGIAEKLLIERMLAAGATPGKERTATEKEEDGEPTKTPVEFAFAIGVKPLFEKDGKTIAERGQGYEYTLHPIVEMKESDSLTHLREASRKAIAPPEQQKKKTA